MTSIPTFRLIILRKPRNDIKPKTHQIQHNNVLYETVIQYDLFHQEPLKNINNENKNQNNIK